MASDSHFRYRFDDFDLDVENRQLLRDGQKLELNGRYFDALVLLVQEHGQLVKKDQFFKEVWGGTVVSDSALTQCIKDIRKQLGDDAFNPRYIKTVPGHGYRFIGSVDTHRLDEAEQNGFLGENPSETISLKSNDKRPVLRAFIIGGTGTLGGIAAGILGGLFYGFGLAYTSADAGMGATSMLLVLTSLNVIIGGMGGLGVSSGMAMAIVTTGGQKIWTVIGGALGGFFIGSLTKLLVVDALKLLFGLAPVGITGGMEGAVIGAAVALGAIIGGGLEAPRGIRPVVAAASASGVAGVLISIAGGHLMGGSLQLLNQSFTGSQLRLDVFGRFFGEMHFGLITQTVLSGIEGFLFGACVVGAMVYLREYLPDSQAKHSVRGD